MAFGGGGVSGLLPVVFLVYKAQNTPQKSYSKCLRQTQIRWVVWRSSIEATLLHHTPTTQFGGQSKVTRNVHGPEPKSTSLSLKAPTPPRLIQHDSCGNRLSGNSKRLESESSRSQQSLITDPPHLSDCTKKAPKTSVLGAFLPWRSRIT